MNVEGRLTVDLDRAAVGNGRARIALSRPLGITRALVGGLPHDAVRTLPLLFNVCGLAQGAAAARACECALGIDTDPETHRVRRLLVLIEMLREHLARAVMDWERFLGFAPQPENLLRVMHLCTKTRRALDPQGAAFAIGAAAVCDREQARSLIVEAAGLVEDRVFGEPLGSWQERQTVADLAYWCTSASTPAQKIVGLVLARGWADAGRAEISFLPQLSDADLAAHLFGPESQSFIAAPTWDGTPRETSAFSRQAENSLVSDVMRVHDSGLLARLVSRLVEIAEIPRAMSEIIEAQDIAQPAGGETEGRGVAHVEAARGRLVHGVEIADEVVRHYTILAPTEWNFHAAGGAARGLADIAGREGDVHALADLFVSSVDPCVGYQLRVH